jgi:hypothetical protein
MTCQEIQDAVLMAEDVSKETAKGTELGRHIESCAACAAFVERLTRVEATAKSLPVPAGSHEAKRATLTQIKWVASHPRRRFFLRPSFLSAAAAMIVFGIGLGIYLAQPGKASAVVDQLVDWDLELADAQGPQQREAIYRTRAPQWESQIRNASLTTEDQQYASALLEHGRWLSTNPDPVDEAVRFSELADLIVNRMNTAAASNDARAVRRFGQHYGRIVQRGIGDKLERMGANASISSEAKRKLDKIARHNAENERRLQILAEKSSSQASQREFKRALEVSRKQGGKFRRGTTTAPQEF